MLADDPGHLWENLQNNGLLSTVTGLEDYEAKTKEGLAMAEAFLTLTPIEAPPASIALNVHQLAFMKVLPTAGQFRDHAVTFGGGYFGAEPGRIVAELELLERQTLDMLAQATNDTEKMQALAFSHVRFERIHPFSDGNGRTGRLLLDAQINAVFGLKERPHLDRGEYMAALKEAQLTGDLTAITNLLCRREGLALLQQQALSPFRIPPFLEDGTTRCLDSDFEQSRGHYTTKKVTFQEPTQKKGIRNLFKF